MQGLKSFPSGHLPDPEPSAAPSGPDLAVPVSLRRPGEPAWVPPEGQAQPFHFAAFREQRFSGGVRCPHCDSDRVGTWGSFAGRQRFRCKACRRTFSDLTGTPLAHLKRLDGWLAHLQSLLAGCSVRATAARAGIHRDTAFRWRHRLLDALDRADTTPLAGAVGLWETPFHLSEKGSRRLDRPARRSGSFVTSQPGAVPLVWVLVARDAQGHVASSVAGRERPGERHFRDLLLSRLAEGASLDFARGAVVTRLAARHGFICGRPPAGCGERRGAGGYVGRLRGWMRRFHGVATRYLAHYLAWHRFLEATRAMASAAAMRHLLVPALPP